MRQSGVVRAIVRKEFLEAWRDRRFVILTLIVAALLALGIGVGAQRFAASAADRADAEQRTYKQWLSQGAKNPHGAAHYGLYALKPETPFAYAERGISDFAGGSVWLEAHRQNLAQNRAAQDGLSIERIGSMTAGFLLQTILPLIIILLGHRSFAGERETGVLAQTISLGVSPVKLFVGKTLGSGAALMALLAPLLAISLAVLAAISAPGEQGWLRALLFLLLYVAYALFWLMLTVGVSAAAKTARTALVTLVAIWMTTSFVAPRLAAEAVRTWRPTPSYRDFTAALDRATMYGLDGKEDAKSFIGRKTGETLARYGVASVAQLPVGYQGLLFTWLEERGDRVFDHYFGQLFDRYRAQERSMQAASLLSPALAARQLSMAVGGTDLATQRAFVGAAEARRRAFIRTMNVDMTKNGRVAAPGATYVAESDLWTKVKPFTFTPPSPIDGLKAQLPSLAALLLQLVLAAMFGVVAVRRIKPGML